MVYFQRDNTRTITLYIPSCSYSCPLEQLGLSPFSVTPAVYIFKAVIMGVPDQESSEESQMTIQEVQPHEYRMDRGLQAWLQVLGSWILFANTWFETVLSSALCYIFTNLWCLLGALQTPLEHLRRFTPTTY